MNKKFGDHVRERRQSLGMSMDDLASKVGYKSRASIGRIESGETDLPISKVSELAKALDTTEIYLLGWDADVPDRGDKTACYLDQETAEAARDISSKPKLKVVMNAARSADAKELDMIADILKMFKAAGRDS